MESNFLLRYSFYCLGKVLPPFGFFALFRYTAINYFAQTIIQYVCKNKLQPGKRQTNLNFAGTFFVNIFLQNFQQVKPG